jgi:hypothetical protein
MVWSLLHTLSRRTVGLAVLRLRAKSAKDVELTALRHEVMGAAPPGLPADMHCAWRQTARADAVSVHVAETTLSIAMTSAAIYAWA